MQAQQAAPAESRCPVAHTATSPTGCPVSAGAAAFDPFGAAYLQDPPEYLRWARAQEPVFYSPTLGYWVVARYDDVKAVFRDNVTFSPSVALEKITPTSQEANDVLAGYGYAMNRTLVNEDEPAHMLRRRLLMEPFTPRELLHHEPLIRQLAREYVDRFIDSGRADLVNQMLWEVPLTVAMHFLGVPKEDMAMVRKFSIAHTVNTWGRPQPSEQVAVAHAVGNFWQLSGRILEKMRAAPDEPGWMQFGIRAQKEHPEIVTDSYLHSMMMAGLVAAHETTANATANALKLLLQHPTAWRQICEDPSLIPGAVEECLRYSGSIIAWRRIAMQDTQVGGVAIPKGGKLLIVMASANHDERHFLDPDLFDIRRENAFEHLSFGYGSHQCMGKNIARLEMQIFLDEFARRLPHMKLAPQEFSYLSNTSFRGPEHLWVEWDPAQNPERRDPSRLQSKLQVRIGDSFRGAAARTAVVDSITLEAEDVLRLRLRAADGGTLPPWTPGAHIDVECGGPELSRQYSLCGDPAQAGVLEIAVLRDPGSRGGSAWLHANVKAGDRLRIRGPRNNFKFDEGARRALFVAGGIGITPIMTMARRARALGIDYAIHYSGRSRASMAFVDELAALHGERLRLYVKDEGQRADLAALLATPQPGTRIYACGPARMLEALQAGTSHWPADALRIEHFHGTGTALDPATAKPFEVELTESGLVIPVRADQTLLGALRAANVDVDSDCEEGICGACEVRVLSGEVEHRDRVLSAAERAANQRMMSCCSRARGGKLVVAL